ncbi:putative membrane protein [Lachnellula cervina]|uniref:Putative membrane protein n=1 Tax=Lachnellula cervina TaxID=1316786 RepID=A0A7D8UMP9_9HELO|nr:putative membrane protein [Lachnellula cervina]
MDDEHEQRNGKTPEENWGAKDSLKRSASLRKTKGTSDDNEVTPLLGSGNRSSGSGNASGSGSDDIGSATELGWEGLADFEGLPWWRKPSVGWLIIPFFLFALAVGGIIVPKLNLIKSLVCREYFIEQSALQPSVFFTPILLGDDNPQCEIPAVQKLVTRFTLYMTILTGGLSAIVSPKLGAFSDRHGRTKVLVITSLGGFLAEILTILAATYPDSIPYQWMLAGSVSDGICGSFTAGMALTHAYAADCTAPPKRNVAFGYFHACLFSGIALGPLLIAIFIKNGGTLIATFYFAMGVHAFFMIFIFFVAPESLSKKRQMLAREKFAAEAANIDLDGYGWMRSANILAPLKILWPTGPGTSSHLRANLILLAAVDTIMFGVGMGALTVTVYYLGFQFHWKTPETSAFVSIINIVRVLTLIAVMPLLNYIFRTRRANKQRRESGFAIPEPNSGSDNLDLNIVRASVVFEIIGYGGYAIVRNGKLFTVAGIFAAFGGIGSPTLQSALTKHVPHDRVGQLLGATGLLHALARVVAPTVFNIIYAQTVDSFPQEIFVVLFGCFCVAFLTSWFIRPHIYLEEPGSTTGNSSRTRLENDPDVLIDEEIIGS